MVFLNRKARQRIALILSWTGLAFIIFSFSTHSLRTPFPGLAALPPVLGAGLLILANRDSLTIPGKLLSLPPIVFIGKISYSLYLWHWPLLVFGKHLSVHETPLQIRWMLVISSFIMGYLSWRFVETPFRNSSLIKNRAEAFKLFTITTLVIATIGTVIYKMEGIPKRFNQELQKIAALADEEKPIKNTKDICNERKVDLYYAVRAAQPPILDTNRYPDRPDVAGHNDAVMDFVKSKNIKKIVLISPLSDRLEEFEESEDKSD